MRGTSRAFRGFTLIELLVSISIIALLLAIILPSLTYAMNASRRVRCLANLRGIGLGIEVYLNEHDQVLPRAFPLDDSAVYGDLDATPDEVNPDGVLATFGPYLDSTEVFICPSDRGIPPELDAVGGPIGRHSSYEYWGGMLMLFREVFADDLEPERAVTKFYEFHPFYPVFADSEQRHPGGPEFDQNALYFGDWRASWLLLDPEDEVAPGEDPP